MGDGKIISGTLPAAGRLDKVLAETTGLSRERIKALIGGGAVTVSKRTATSGSAKAAGGEAYSIALPPPVPLAATYFVAINGQQAGPFDIPTLAAKVQSGEVTRGSLVWKAGMAGWTAADQVADLSGLFKAGPPPLPT